MVQKEKLVEGVESTDESVETLSVEPMITPLSIHKECPSHRSVG